MIKNVISIKNEKNFSQKNTDRKKKAKIPYHRKPENLTTDEWQIALRQQFAETQKFKVENIGGGEVFSDYKVSNFIGSGNTYKVAIRDAKSDWNFCSCMDFKTNQLGTCKHIEYVLLQINSSAKKKKILKAGFQPHYTSVYLNYGAEIEIKIRIGTENKEEFEKLASEYFDKEYKLLQQNWQSFDTFLQKAYSLHPDFCCYPDAMDFILEKREEKQRNELIDKTLITKDKFFKTIIKANLFPYQKEGIEFALRKGRCLIADDMGLGKTIQAIAASEAMKTLFGITKVLIVCPTSLKYQWKSEIEKFTDSTLTVIEGNAFVRETQYKNDDFYKICSYNVVGSDIKNINQNEFDLVILDEAQRIKNWQTKTAANVKKMQSKYCIVLTGTPLENKLEELYSVVQMVNPLLLGALFRFVSAHQITNEETGKVVGYKDLDKIAEILQGVLLRRHKTQVLKQLPERMDKNLFVPMTEEQSIYYNDAHDIVVRLVNKWIRFKFLNEKDRQKLLIHLNMMRMACNSTFIIDQQPKRYDTKIDEVMNILDEVMENGDDKVVIFSQWERMTRIVGNELEKRNIGYESLHGGVPSKEREKLFDNFRNNPESRVFLSTDAGGVGLNLQSASLLINLDLPWNPAVLEQRIARVHRMGQKKSVQVINLISKDTIEEEMLAKLKFKSSVAAGILDNGESSVFLGESKFNELMNQVKDLAGNAVEPLVNTEEKRIGSGEDNMFEKPKPQEKEIVSQSVKTDDEETISETEKQLKLFDNQDDNDSATSDAFKQSEAEKLVSSGTDFFGKLIQTLSDKDQTEQLLQTLVKKDEDGNTYLKIPVKNEQIIKTA